MSVTVPLDIRDIAATLAAYAINLAGGKDLAPFEIENLLDLCAAAGVRSDRDHFTQTVLTVQRDRAIAIRQSKLYADIVSPKEAVPRRSWWRRVFA